MDLPRPVPPADPVPALASSTEAAQAEVASIVQQLLRIDTTNYGSDDGAGEAEAAEYCQAMLADAGIDCERFHTDAGHRQGVVARIAGQDSDRPALLVHGHLDVVPAVASEWEHPPFSGELVDDVLWGRGAVDMKDMVGMTLAVVRQWARSGIRPQRDIVLMYVPDEEAGMRHGSHWIVDNRPELLHGVTEAVGEVGGFSVTLTPQVRVYPVQIAEKGIAWMKITAHGTPGHGSFVNEDNAVAKLVEAAARLARHRFEVRVTPAARQLFEVLSEIAGVRIEPGSKDVESLLAQLGSAGRVVSATMRHTANLTMLEAGFKHNVIPARASACIDGRFLPGLEEEFLAQIDELLGPGITREWVNRDIGVETTFDGETVDAMAAALRAEDPAGRPVPFLMPGGTDAKAWARLGIRCFGFSPLRLPPDLDFFGLFHAHNERVPVPALKFGTRVLDRFLRAA